MEGQCGFKRFHNASSFYLVDFRTIGGLVTRLAPFTDSYCLDLEMESHLPQKNKTYKSE